MGVYAALPAVAMVVMVFVLTYVVLAVPRVVAGAPSYFLHDRDLGPFRGAITYTSAWTQPLALFASGWFAYLGPWHFLAFALPNIIAISFGMLVGPAMRRAKHNGYTLPEAFGHVFSGLAGSLLRSLFALFAYISLAYTMALNLTMLSAANQATLRLWIGDYLGMGALTFSVIAGVIACIWAMPHGMRGAIRGDTLKVSFILCGVLGIAALWNKTTELQASAVFVAEASPMSVLWMYGIPFSISLIGGFISNPDMVERNYSIREKNLLAASFGSIALFSAILLGYGSLGFLARWMGLSLTKDQLPIIELAGFVPYAKTAMVMAVSFVLIASLASALVSSSNIWGTELIKRFKLSPSEQGTIAWSRVLMLLTLFGGFVMAWRVDNIAILLQNMGVIRGGQIVAIFVLLFFPRAVSPWAVLAGAVGGELGGGYFAFVANNPPLGAVVALLVPLACCVSSAVLRARRLSVADVP